MSHYSDGYSNYGTYGDYSPPPPRSSGCFRGCLIAAVILFLLLAGLVGAGYWFYSQITKGVTVDPTEVMRRLKEQFPTAELPPGYSARAGFRFEMFIKLDLLIFAKAGAEIDEEGAIVSGDAMMLFQARVPGDQPPDLNFDQIGRQQRLVEKRPYPLRVDGYEFEASWQKTVDRDQVTRVQIAVVLHPDTMLVMQGDAERVDEEALRLFLKSIAPACRSAKRIRPDKDAEQPADAGADGPATKNKNQKEAADKKNGVPAKQEAPANHKTRPSGPQPVPTAPDDERPKPDLPPPDFHGHAPEPSVQVRTATITVATKAWERRGMPTPGRNRLMRV